MCRAIAMLKNRINLELIEEYNLSSLLRQRAAGAEEEIVFDFANRRNEPMLPAIDDGQLRIHLWGNRGDRESKLPKTGWCRQESLSAGKWRWLRPKQVFIPADYGLEKGVWFTPLDGAEGMTGVLVLDERNRPHVYMLTQPASVYYRNMTRHQCMPVFASQRDGGEE